MQVIEVEYLSKTGDTESERLMTSYSCCFRKTALCSHFKTHVGIQYRMGNWWYAHTVFNKIILYTWDINLLRTTEKHLLHKFKNTVWSRCLKYGKGTPKSSSFFTPSPPPPLHPLSLKVEIIVFSETFSQWSRGKKNLKQMSRWVCKHRQNPILGEVGLRDLC